MGASETSIGLHRWWPGIGEQRNRKLAYLPPSVGVECLPSVIVLTLNAGNNLWEITNRVHANLLRGGMRDTCRVNRAGKPFRAMRAIRGLGANVDINLGLWALAESFRLN